MVLQGSFRIAALAAAAVVMLGAPAAAQDDPARRLLESAAEAMGGLERLESVRNVVLTGFGQRLYQDGGGNVTGDVNAPPKWRAVSDAQRTFDLENGRALNQERQSYMFPFAAPFGLSWNRTATLQTGADVLDHPLPALLEALKPSTKLGAVTVENGQSVVQLIHQDAQQFEAASQQLFETGAWSGELIQQTRRGDVLTIAASWSLLCDDQGRPKLVLALNTDITERRQLELQVVRAQRLESLAVLAGGIAHDFNNILTAIVANAGLVRLACDTAEARESLQQIEQASERGAELVRQLFTFSREREQHREPIDLTRVVAESARLLRASLTVDIHTRFAPDVPPILADQTQMHQVLINLITNAAHAMAQSRGTIEVEVDRAVIEPGSTAHQLDLQPGTYARLRVSDTGSGMSEATRQRIFEPFFTTKPIGQGTGLGLAVVHGIVESHQGSIAVSSTPEQGTMFELLFPAAE